MAIMSNDKKVKLYVGNMRVKKVFAGDKRVYSAGNVCTYHVDGNTYQEEIDEGASCLSPTSFIPQKDGWEFLGWRDTQTAGAALTEKVMGEEPIDLYAMFKYPDYAYNMPRQSWDDPSWPSEKYLCYDIDQAKYCGYYFNDCYFRLNINFDAGNLYMIVSPEYARVENTPFGNGACFLGQASKNNKIEGQREKMTVYFTRDTGITSLVVWFYAIGNTTINAIFQPGAGHFIGRTIVG